MHIRSLVPSDKDSLEKLYKKLYPQNPVYDLSNGIFQAKNLLLGLEEEGNLIGFLQGVFFHVSGRDECYINDLIIDDEYRGKGYGRQLVMAAEAEFRQMGGSYIFIFTDFEDQTENPVGFYEKCGYKIIQSPVLVKRLEKGIK
jgi:ribosomal protein S18 acetylase RimI-like enzyme